MLNKKLATLNNRSDLNCYPSYPDFLDIYQLNQEDADDFVFQWIKNLIDGQTVSMSSSVSFGVQEQLSYLFFDNRNYLKLKGGAVTAFGFPILGIFIDQQLIYAPLILWPIKMAADTHRVNHWNFTTLHTLGRGSSQKPRVNRALLENLSQIGQLDFESLLNHQDWSRKGLLEWLSSLEEQIGFEWTERQIAIAKTPSIEHLDQIGPNGKLFWSGVLSNFADQGLILNQELPPLTCETTDFKGHPFGLLELSPEQESVFQKGRTLKLSAVSGQLGSGKTYTLGHAITHALANKQSVLYVSKSISSLFEIQKLLAQFDLSHLNFLLQSPEVDASLLIELLKAAALNTDLKYAFDTEKYDKWLEKGNRLYHKYNEQYQQVHHKVFGQKSWTETVGLFLRNERQQPKVSLASQLTATDFEFNESEYTGLQKSIVESKNAFEKIQTLNHPLIQVHPRVFTEMERKEAAVFLQQQTNRLLDRTAQLHQRYINKSQAYNDRLFRFLTSQYQRLFQHQTKLSDIIAEYTNQYGDDYLNASNSSLKFKGIFSSKSKDITQAKEETFEQYNRIVNTYQQNTPFDFTFPAERDLKQVAHLKTFIPKFSKALEQWRLQIPALVQEDMVRLNNKTLVPSLGFKDQIEELEEALDRLVENINNARIFREPLKSQMLTIPKRQKYLEAIIDRIENIQFNLRDFNDFYSWQRHWLFMSEEARKVVKSLIKVKVHNWEAAFNSWYFNNTLLRHYSPLLPDQEVNLKDIARLIDRAPVELINYIKFYWQQKKEQALKQFKKEEKNLYQQLFGKKNQALSTDIRFADWFAGGINVISSIIPVFFTSPSVAAECFARMTAVFDVVIIDEVQELNQQEGRFLCQLGKRAILSFPDINTPGEFVQEFIATQENVEFLKEVKRFYPANLFQNPPIDDDYNQKIHFDQVDGRYDENKKINEVEAQHIIRILNQIQKTPQQTYPKVGIACFTKEQRNLILSYLQEIRKRMNQGGDKIKQLERNGLGVFHIHELYGQHFDVLMVSTTFGPIDLNGTLTGHLSEMNQPQTEKWIKILASRAINEIFFTTSLQEELIDRILSQKIKEGLTYLAAYYKFIQFGAQNQMAKQAAIIADLQQAQFEETPFYGQTFAEEVAVSIKPYLAGRQIKTNIKEDGQHFPILIESQEEQSAAIVCKLDGFWFHRSYTNFKLEFEYDQLLEKSGYRVLSVWSAAWWKSPDEEARKLASAILKLA